MPVRNSTMRRLWRHLFRLPLWWIRFHLGFVPSSTTETYAALVLSTRSKARYTPGSFTFPFGLLRYVDGLSFRYQYLEIFLERGYDFETAAEQPYIVDCGGNVGLATVRLKQLHPGAEVTVYEADPRIVPILRSNLERLRLTNVRVLGAAVSDRNGDASFDADGADSGRLSEGGDIRVPSVRLATAIDRPVDLLKLDVEGAEYAIIEDLASFGSLQLVRRLVCEVHGRPGDEPRMVRLLATLVNAGFRVSIPYARQAPDLKAATGRTPFCCLQSPSFLAHVYAWKPEI